MSESIKWSRRDKRRAQEVLSLLNKHYGGWQKLADELGMTARSSRSTTQAWYRRGRVSLPYLQPTIELARRAGIACTPGELSPQAKHLEKVI